MVRSIGTTNRTSVPSGSMAVRGWSHNNVFSICEMFCARLVCEWPLIARADTQTLAVINVCLPVPTTKLLQKRGTVFCSVPLLSVPFGFFHFFSFCVAQSMSMQYFSQRYLTATGGRILVDGDTPICRSSSWSESNHRRKVGSDTPAACANSDLSFDLYFSIFLLVLLFSMSCTRALCARESFVHFPR